MMRALAFALMAVTLASCGRLGPVRPPGPAEAVTYPRQYPTARRPATPPAPAQEDLPEDAPARR